MAAPYRVLVSGASGMVGRALVGALAVPSAFNRFNPEVHLLVRHRPTHTREVWWDPMEMRIDLAGCENFDAVVHLAGEAAGGGGGWRRGKQHTSTGRGGGSVVQPPCGPTRAASSTWARNHGR